MNEKETVDLINSVLADNKKASQYGVSRTSVHTHNNIDSPPIVRSKANGNSLIVSDGTTDVSPTDEIDFVGAVVVKNVTTATVEIIRYILYRVLAPTTTEATGTTVGGDLVMPFTGTLTSVGATVDTAGTTGTTQLDINKNTTTILSTKITIDSTEKTSRTAATPSVISVPTFVTGDIFTFDVDTVQTTPALGLTFFLVATQTA